MRIERVHTLTALQGMGFYGGGGFMLSWRMGQGLSLSCAGILASLRRDFGFAAQRQFLMAGRNSWMVDFKSTHGGDGDEERRTLQFFDEEPGQSPKQ